MPKEARPMRFAGGSGPVAPTPPPCRLLEEMRANPLNNWTVSDVKAMCSQVGLKCAEPTRGSHYKVRSEHVGGILTVVARRPIKPVYIRKLVSLADAHRKATLALEDGR